MYNASMNDTYLFVFTKIASTEGFIVVAILICTFLALRNRKAEATLFCVTSFLLMISVQILKEIFKIPRPPESLIEASGYAFPSGHAAGSIFLAMSIIFLSRNTPRTLRYTIWITTMILAILIGTSRIQLGVHTLTQVMAGYVLGCLCVTIFLVARKTYYTKTSN